MTPPHSHIAGALRGADIANMEYRQGPSGGALKARKELLLETIPENLEEDESCVSLGQHQLGDNDGITTSTTPADHMPSKNKPSIIVGATSVRPAFKDQARTQDQRSLQQQQIPSVKGVSMDPPTNNANRAETTRTIQAEVMPNHRRSELLQLMIDAKNMIGSDIERATIDTGSNASISSSNNNSATAELVEEEPNGTSIRIDRRNQNVWVVMLLITIAVVVGVALVVLVLNHDEDKFSWPPGNDENADADNIITGDEDEFSWPPGFGEIADADNIITVDDKAKGAHLFWKGQSAFLSATNVQLTFDDGAKYSFVDDSGRKVAISTAGPRGYEINWDQRWEEGGKERRLQFYFSYSQSKAGNRLIESRAYDQTEEWVYSIMPSSRIFMPPDSLFHCDFVEFNYGTECSGFNACSNAKLVAEDFYVGAYLGSYSYEECTMNVFHPCSTNTDGNTVCRVTDGVLTCVRPDNDSPKLGADSRKCFGDFD